VTLKSLISFYPFPAGFFRGARERVKKSVLVIDANKEQCRELCELLKEGQFKAKPLFSNHNLEKSVKETGCQAIFWDIDTVPADNRTVRDLTIKFPGIYFFCLSKHPFHPELKDAICYHIYACINRPINPDELFYWLRSIDENELNPDRSANP
jgi:DNA-binding NtrC family response regulator